MRQEFHRKPQNGSTLEEKSPQRLERGFVVRSLRDAAFEAASNEFQAVDSSCWIWSFRGLKLVDAQGKI